MFTFFEKFRNNRYNKNFINMAKKSRSPSWKECFGYLDLPVEERLGTIKLLPSAYLVRNFECSYGLATLLTDEQLTGIAKEHGRLSRDAILEFIVEKLEISYNTLLSHIISKIDETESLDELCDLDTSVQIIFRNMDRYEYGKINELSLNEVMDIIQDKEDSIELQKYLDTISPNINEGLKLRNSFNQRSKNTESIELHLKTALNLDQKLVPKLQGKEKDLKTMLEIANKHKLEPYIKELEKDLSKLKKQLEKLQQNIEDAKQVLNIAA